MKVRCVSVTLVVTLLSVGSADAVEIDTVPIGNPGNAADTTGNPNPAGSVSYTYRIGKYDVTNAQYVEFLNGVDPIGANALALYDGSMSSDARGGINFISGAANGSKYGIKPGRDNNPVVYVNWYDAIRFANWLHNGQGAGDTESGAYTLLGGTPTPSNGNSITRNAGARRWLPSEDEWYKAAYHKNDGVTGNYWDYPTSTDDVLYSDQPPGTDAPDQSNTANFFSYDGDGEINGYDDGYAVTGSNSYDHSQNYLTDVGAYTLSTSPYGTFDQGGNVWEWNEALISGSFRGIRGSSWSNVDHFGLAAWERGLNGPSSKAPHIGFRVASIPASIPGDFNHDGAVDAADYVVWRKTGSPAFGYEEWRANFGTGSTAPAQGDVLLNGTAAAEPSSIVLLVMGVLLLRHRFNPAARRG